MIFLQHLEGIAALAPCCGGGHSDSWAFILDSGSLFWKLVDSSLCPQCSKVSGGCTLKGVCSHPYPGRSVVLLFGGSCPSVLGEWLGAQSHPDPPETTILTSKQGAWLRVQRKGSEHTGCRHSQDRHAPGRIPPPSIAPGVHSPPTPVSSSPENETPNFPQLQSLCPQLPPCQLTIWLSGWLGQFPLSHLFSQPPKPCCGLIFRPPLLCGRFTLFFSRVTLQ